MKIQNDPLRALLEQGEAHRKSKAGGEAFESLLAQQLQQTQGGTQGAFIQSAEQNSAALAMQIRAAQELGGATGEEKENGIDFLMERMNGLLNKWDTYAGAMGRPDLANLKDMNGLLNGMSKELQSIKESMPELAETGELAGLFNELEVLATTERIKFDRGDYL